MGARNTAPNERARRTSSAILTLLALLIAASAAAQSGGDGSGQGSAQGSSGGGSGLTGVPGPYGETLTIDIKGITLQFPDNAAKLRIGGRLQLDYGAVGVSPRGFGPAFDDNFAVRRSWIESYLTPHDVIELAFQYDFSNATAPIQDAAIAYHGFEPFLFTVGNFKGKSA